MLRGRGVGYCSGIESIEEEYREAESLSSGGCERRR